MNIPNDGGEEAVAMAGLNVRGYFGKWNTAKALASKNERTDNNRLLPYWERVRLLFLELGGEYTHAGVSDP